MKQEKRGDGRIRTAVGGFADLYLATRSRHRIGDANLHLNLTYAKFKVAFPE